MAGNNSSPSQSRGLSSILGRTQGVMRRHMWVGPLLTALMLVFVGVFVRGRMEEAMKTQIAATLQTVLAANSEALRAWVTTMKAQAEIFASDERVRQLAGELVQLPRSAGLAQAQLLSAPQNTALRALLRPAAQSRGFDGYVVLDTNLMVVASGREQLIGMQALPGHAENFRACFAGQSLVSHPFPSVTLLPDADGQLRTGVATMYAGAPIHGTDGQVIAVLGLRILPDKDFTRILSTAQWGQSGETYAFNRAGLLLSKSRFDEELKRLGLIPDTPQSDSILTLELRDPLVDLTQGETSPTRRTELPIKRAVADAIAGKSGVATAAYRDYRGVPSVGAWAWLPDLDLGLVTELDASEAYAPLHILRAGFFFMLGLLALGGVIIFVLMRLANRLQDSARSAALKAKQLGQYALEDKIGEGAFGAVYRGHHALMRRPVAVKVLHGEANDTTIARFEREVRMTCQLTHPNTIALYDYGRTQDGLFYYAMEYLEGLTLNALVNSYGRLPEGRVIYILRQVCASLAEAHGQGLIHRDIKPHNIFLTRRGDMPDFVKVLDFGLVKARNVEDQADLTGANATPGTPRYMSPETIEHPDQADARSDLYSLGTVGYFLLTGETVFFGVTIGEVLMQQVKAEPEPPSIRLKKPVSPDLEALLMRCLAKKAADRPASARELEEALSRCASAGQWGREQAEEWWRRYDATNTDRTAVVPQTTAQPQPA